MGFYACFNWSPLRFLSVRPVRSFNSSHTFFSHFLILPNNTFYLSQYTLNTICNHDRSDNQSLIGIYSQKNRLVHSSKGWSSPGSDNPYEHSQCLQEQSP